MPSEKQPFYDPVPPTYDEALASSSNIRSRYRNHDDGDGGVEADHLLPRQESSASAAARRPRNGYRPPTVETDDEDSLFGSDDDDDDVEAAHVRQEMQEMDIEEPSTWRGSNWSKRIGFTLSLPRWKWSWRPRLPRLNMQLPSRPSTADGEANTSANTDNDATDTPTRNAWQWRLPRMDRMTLVLAFARIVAITVIVGFVYFLFASGIFGSLSSRLNSGMRFDPEDLRLHVQRSIEARRLRASVSHFSSYAHIAGTEGDFATAMDVESMLVRAGLDKVEVDEYHVYLNYPRQDGRSVHILGDKGDEPIWTAKLQEEEHDEEKVGRQTYAFHGHSKSGDVRGPLVYANYGSRDDFKLLKERGIETQGAIALVRYYGTETDLALKVKAAELAGFAGCLIYSDPADDGFVLGDVAPDGRYMPSDGVQRGAVSMTSWVVGDVLTPGWESKKGLPRTKINESTALVQIPSLPLAWRDAQVLLGHLQGHGQLVPPEWKGGVPDIKEWWTGNGSSPVVRLRNEQDEVEQQPIWNVYGRIVGMEQDARSVMVGNHRDAWGLGAVDPHTGTAIMIELARIFGGLVGRGWRPLRTIEFMSWDAGEYNLIGSTEYVEKNLDGLREGGYAYINLDSAVSGSKLHAAGSPVLQRSLERALDRVVDPNANATLRELWQPAGGLLAGLGAGSDYVAFQDIAGTSSLDLSFEGAPYPHHSSYETLELVEHVIDPGFVYTSLLAQVVGLLVLELADRAVLPFGMEAYGKALGAWVGELDKWVEERKQKEQKQGRAHQPRGEPKGEESRGDEAEEKAKEDAEKTKKDAEKTKDAKDDDKTKDDEDKSKEAKADKKEEVKQPTEKEDNEGKQGKESVDLAELHQAVALVQRRTADFARWEIEWDRQVLASGGWEAKELGLARTAYNDKMAAFETALLDVELGGGIPNRTQFKHVVFGPQLWSGYDGTYFPAIRDCVDAGDWDLARRVTAKTAAILRGAAETLNLDAGKDKGEAP